jgi:hypothetical protein
MENRISELQAKNEILAHELDNILFQMDEAKAAENLKLAKWFQDLTGIANVTVTMSTDKTTVGIPHPGDDRWPNEINIYHGNGDHAKGCRRFELGWFASSATVKSDATTSGYLQYLTALGRISEAFSTGNTIQDTIGLSFALLDPIKALYRKIAAEKAYIELEIRTINQDFEKAKLLGLISGPVATIPVVGNHLYENRQKFTKPAESSAQCWQLSARNTVVFDCLTIIKNKGNWKVIFHELGWTRNDAGDTVKSHYDLKNCETKGFKQDAMIEMLKYLMPGINAANLITA